MTTRARAPHPEATRASLTRFGASPETLAHLIALVTAIRPDWDPGLVRIVLASHSSTVLASDLAIASLRCAADPSMPYPKAIGWRGPHWDGLTTTPLDAPSTERCDVCGKTEPRCYSTRVGVDDDHAFTPHRPLRDRSPR